MGVFRKLGVPYFRGPYHKDPNQLGYYIRVPYFRKLPYGFPYKAYKASLSRSGLHQGFFERLMRFSKLQVVL